MPAAPAPAREKSAAPAHPPDRAARALLPLLVLLSGFCGISYEILYARLLGNLLGNQFTINATVLLTFLLGIGLGTRLAHRFVRWLWAIEAGIGLYAAAMVAGMGAVERLVFALLPQLGTSLAACALVGIALLSVPACLIGCSLPLFAAYLGSLRRERVFSVTYGFYNVGAAATALLMEFALLRSVGLRTATLLLAGLNLAVAACLFELTRREAIAPAPATERIHFPRHVLVALVVASVGSAVFQLLMIKLGELVLGPFNETFALVLATTLLGLSLGAVVTARFALGFQGALLLALAGLLGVLALLPAETALYAALHPAAARSYPTLVAEKLALVFALMALPAVGFGATIPALLRTTSHVARESGELLFYSSLANAGGFLLMAFGLHRHLDYGSIVVVIAALAASAVWIHARRPGRAAGAAFALLLLAGVAHRTLWDEDLLYLGHVSFLSAATLREVREDRVVAEQFKGADDVFAIVWRRGRPHFFINGYFSIPLDDVSEKLVGALSSMLAPRTDRALVLGVGSGATAATVGLVFDRTDAVEINPVVLANLHRMAPWNFDIEHIPGVSLIHDDGIRFVRTSRDRYSLILNTVTTPLYFSSSKLYTDDFFDLVTSRLAPDGVYTTWIDLRIGDRGVDIVLETLARRFASCWVAYVTSGYYLLACSNGDLGLHSHAVVAGQPVLREQFAETFGLPIELLPYAILSTEALALRDPGAPLNTLDFPVLEFEMARLQENASIDRFRSRVFGSIDPEALRRAWARTLPWRPADFDRFSRLRLAQLQAVGEGHPVVGPGPHAPIPPAPAGSPRP